MHQFKLTEFTYSKTQLVSEASSLRLPPGQTLRSFEVKSHVTGLVVPFEFVHCERNRDMDVLYWEYASVGEWPEVFTARVYND